MTGSDERLVPCFSIYFGWETWRELQKFRPIGDCGGERVCARAIALAAGRCEGALCRHRRRHVVIVDRVEQLSAAWRHCGRSAAISLFFLWTSGRVMSTVSRHIAVTPKEFFRRRWRCDAFIAVRSASQHGHFFDLSSLKHLLFVSGYWILTRGAQRPTFKVELVDFVLAFVPAWGIIAMQRDSHGSGVDPRSYVGPYRMDKTLGKGQTGINLNLTSFLLSISLSLSLSLCFFCLTVKIFSLPPFFLPPLPHQRLSYSFFSFAFVVIDRLH